jgi:ribosomal-protein-alanine N-acetyltransferase
LAVQPTLQTRRLVLRPFAASDAPVVRRLAGEKDIADTTLNIPYPYPDGAAEAWIATHSQRFADGVSAIFAIVDRHSRSLIGSIALEISAEHAMAEMGYWIGRSYWNQGYCTEAAKALLGFAFDELGLNRVQARHLARNPASGRVMQKIGMSHEAHLRQAVVKWGKFEDVALFAILRKDYVH